MRKHLLITGLCCGVAFVLPAPSALAQTTGQTTDHQRIQALEARVAALEQRLDMSPATPQPQPLPQPQSPPVATPSPPMSHPQPSPAMAPTPAVTPDKPAPIATLRPAASDWSHLRRGMNPRQVTEQLGRPDRKQVRPLSEIWFYPDDRQVEFDNGNRLQSWSKP